MQLYWFVLLIGLVPNYGVATNEDPSCFDERDCSTLRAWMSNPDDLARYCAEFKDDPAVKLCKRTCQVCKAPAGENQECKDESSVCYTINQKYPGIKDQMAKQNYCEYHKHSSFMKQCKRTCRLCPPYLLSFPTPIPSAGHIECKDESITCEHTKAWYHNNPEGFAHYCRDNKQKCKKTCNLCENPTKPPSVTGPTCYDEDNSCMNIVDAHHGDEEKILRYCRQWMGSDPLLRKCRKTCQLCGSHHQHK